MTTQNDKELIPLIHQAGLLASQGFYAKAQALLAPAMEKYGPHPHLWHNWAQILADSGNVIEAEKWFCQCVDRWSTFLPPYETLIHLVRNRLGPRPHPEALYFLAILYNNQGNAIEATGDYPQACAKYRQSLSFNEKYANAWSNLSNSLRPMGLVSEAEECARKAIAINQTHVGAWNNLGCALTNLGQIPEAEQCFAEVLRLEPNHPMARHNAGSGRMFNLLFIESLENADILKAHKEWGKQFAHRSMEKKNQTKTVGTKVRVGFISGDFRVHAMSLFVVPLLQHLDRDRFEIFCYANQRRFDGVSAFIRSLPLTWRETITLSDEDCKELIRGDRLDLLLDLSGHTEGHRASMLALRPAPLIAGWLGYMASTGHPAIDYRITDRWTDPEPESALAHTETIAYLKGSQFVYRPEIQAPSVNSTPALVNGYVTFGSLNNVRKLTISTLKLWSDLLHRLPNSRLILQAKLFVDLGTKGYFRGVFEAFGIDFNRIELRSYSLNNQHLMTYHDIDIALDPYPYGGGATSCDALWMGVPLVTLAGNRSVGRMGVSILNALGYPQWIAKDHLEYIQIAQDLASDLVGLNSIRLGLREQLGASPLRDEAGFAKDFGQTLLLMVNGVPE